MSEEGKSFAGRAADCWSAMRANPDRSMHLTSIIAGVLLFIGGLSGLINLLNPLGMVLSVYNIIFAGLILTSELKALPVFKTLNKRVDLYFHILSVPRGKAGFYVFIGILAFLGTHDWSISRICILLVAIVGAIQMTSHCIRGTGASVEAAGAAGGQPSPGLTSSMTGSDATAGANPFTSFAMEAVSDAPSLGRAGLSAAATFASTTAPATA